MGDVVPVSAANAYTCATLASNGIKCWGHNFYGQVGDGTITDRVKPVEVIGFPEAGPYPSSQVPIPVGPMTSEVNSTADTTDQDRGDGVCDDGTGNCTLRAAIMEANTLEGLDSIIIPGGSYGLSLTGEGEDSDGIGHLDITDDLSIL